ncbi:MAG: hypothetical protein IKX92_01070, partial [Clostridia bacterium]|nr:hypothetical protein [Clostridia bacterium]
MFLQLEHGESIAEKDIIGIFDLDGAGASPLTKPLFVRKEEEKGVVSLASDIPVSFVLAQGEYGDTIDSASAMLSLFANFPSKAQLITYAIYFIAYFFGTILSF